MQLTQEQIAQFDRDGYLFFPSLLVVSLDSVDEIRTTRACSLSTPDARDTSHLRIALWNAPPAPVVRGRRPAVRASKSRNTLARYGPWQQVIRSPEPQRSQGAGSPKQW